MKQREPVRIGIIGCGQMAQLAHLPCLQANSGANLVGICDQSQEVAKKVAAQYGIPYATDQPEALLRQSVDALVILTPGSTHLPLLKLALTAKVPTFVEKPAAISADSVQSLIDLREDAGVGVQVGYMKRHEANISRLLQIQSENDWGPLLFARSHSFIGAHWNGAIDRLITPITPSGPIEMSAPMELDPGPSWLEGARDAKFHSFENPYYAWLDTGIHSINLLQYLTNGPVDVDAVFAGKSAKVAHLKFGGVPVTMEFCVNFAMNRWDEVTELFYEKASVQIKTPPPLDRQSSAEVTIYSESNGSHQSLSFEDNRQWAFQNQMDSFVESIQTGASFNDLPQSLKDLKLMECMYRKQNR